MIDKISPKKIKYVGMNEVSISSNDQPIIGTGALGPCVGVLIYTKNKKRAVVLHTSYGWEKLVEETLFILLDNELIKEENCIKLFHILALYKRYDLFIFDDETIQQFIEKANLTISNNSNNDNFEVTIIPGYYQDNYDIAKNLKKFFQNIPQLFQINNQKLPQNAIKIQISQDLGAHEFYFDASTGKFVTDKIDYLEENVPTIHNK